MVKATELRLGNYVGFYKPEIHEPQQGFVDGIELDYDDNEYKIRVPAFSKYPLTEAGIFPIPLTEEWLEKFGFYRIEAENLFAHDSTMVDIVLGKWIRVNGLSSKIKLKDEFHFVHQLQNLIFALTGKELTIKKLTT